jgi:hypothetical protein
MPQRHIFFVMRATLGSQFFFFKNNNLGWIFFQIFFDKVLKHIINLKKFKDTTNLLEKC